MLPRSLIASGDETVDLSSGLVCIRNRAHLAVGQIGAAPRYVHRIGVNRLLGHLQRGQVEFRKFDGAPCRAVLFEA